jgi:hypothetical protein
MKTIIFLSSLFFTFSPFSLNAHFKSQIPSKTFNFNQMTAGDCVLADGSTVTIWADGNIEFSGTVWTNHTHSGDQWHHIITFLDSRGLTLFTMRFEGPDHMNDDGTHYNFGPSWQKFDPKFFNDVSTATAKGFC